MAKSRILDIGEVAEVSGLSASTLRFYEEKGLIASSGRHGLRRLFASQVLVQLDFIALGSQAGFTLEEMAGMMAGDGRFQINRQQLLAKAIEVDRNLRRLTAVRNGLRHAASCPASNHLECPKFQRLLRAAGRKQAKTRKTKRSPFANSRTRG